MKIISRKNRDTVAILSLISFLLIITLSCEKKEVPRLSDEDLKEIYLINSPWKLDRATVDGVNESNTYRDLTLSFTRTSFNSTNGRIIWPESGTWEFINEENSVFRRDDGLLVTIQSITASNMTLTFDWEFTSIDTGRSNAISGKHIFEFVK